MSESLRRLFSSFARGGPGVGLLLMRVVTALVLLSQAALTLRRGGSIDSSALAVSAGGAGILLLAGLWTPIAGVAVAAISLWNAVAQPGDPWIYILLSSMGVALALLGPGAWSIDARLFGWKRIDIQDRKS